MNFQIPRLLNSCRDFAFETNKMHIFQSSYSAFGKGPAGITGPGKYAMPHKAGGPQ